MAAEGAPAAEGPGEASVVVAGPPGAGKTALLDALLGVEAVEGEEGPAAAPAAPAPSGLKPPALRAHPSHPNWLFWELSLREEEEEEGEAAAAAAAGAAGRWLAEAEAAALVLVAGPREGRFGAAQRCLAREARAQGRSVFFARSRADLELHTLRRLMGPRRFRRDQALRALREVSARALEEPGGEGRLDAEAAEAAVFLVSALEPHALDLPRMKAALEAELCARERVQPPPDLGFEVISDQEAAEMQEAYALGGLAAVADRLEGSLEALWSTQVDLALVMAPQEGEGTGSGGPALADVLRGVEEGEGGPNLTEEIPRPVPYPFSGHPNVTLWGLQAGDPEAEDVARFDAFLLLAPGPFGEGLLQVARAAATQGKPCFFIRQLEVFWEEEEEEEEGIFLAGLLAECRSHLSKGGIPVEAPLFFLGSRGPRRLGLSVLEEALAQGLPGPKGRALLLALPCISPALVECKRRALHQETWKVALLCSLVAAVPLPGLASACDVPLLLRTLSSYRRVLGLDAASLVRLSGRSGVSLAVLRREVRSTVGRGVSQEAIQGLLGHVAGGGAGLALAHLLAHRLPLCGALASGGLSFHATYALLGHCLEELVVDSQHLLRRAAQGSGD